MPHGFVYLSSNNLLDTFAYPNRVAAQRPIFFFQGKITCQITSGYQMGAKIQWLPNSWVLQGLNESHEKKFKTEWIPIVFDKNGPTMVSILSFQRYWWSKNPVWHPSVTVLNAALPYWLSPCQKLKISTGSFWFYCWSKYPSIWLYQRHNMPQPAQKWVPEVLCSLDDFLHAKSLCSLHSIHRYDDQRILQSDCVNGTTRSMQPKVVSHVTFLWWLSPCKKSKR